MQDNSNNSEQNKPQQRPWFSPKPDIPRGKNLIGDNPFYNYLAKPGPNVAMRQPIQPNIPTPPLSLQPNALPFYGGSRQHYKDTADILWNEPEFNFKSLDPTNLEHMKYAQTSLSDWMDEHIVNIMMNPNPSYQEKQFVKEQLDYNLRDPRFSSFYNIFKLQKKKVQQDEEEFNRLKAEEEELKKNFDSYGTFKDSIHSDITDLIRKGGDINLLLKPTPENFPQIIEYLARNPMTSAEYDKIFNTRREGFWDRLFGSGNLEVDDIEKIYKGLRLYSKKPQAFGKFLEGIDPLYTDWAKKHYIKNIEEGGEPFDSNIKYALNQLHTKLLEEGKQRPTDNEEEINKKVEQWKDENIKEILRFKAHKQPAKNLANALTELIKVQNKFPKSLSEQPKEIDLDNFILGSRELNDYLYQFLKTDPYGDWEKKIRKDLKKAFIPYYNQHLSYGNTIDKLINAIDNKVKKAGGIENFLLENIKREKEKGIITSQTPETIFNNLKDNIAYFKKKNKQRSDRELTEKIITDLAPELEEELISQATKKINEDFDKLKSYSQTPDKNLPEIKSTIEKTIDDIITYYKTNTFGPGGKLLEDIENKVTPYVIQAYDKLRTYVEDQYNNLPEIKENAKEVFKIVKNLIHDKYELAKSEFSKIKDIDTTFILEKQKEILQETVNFFTQLKNYISEQYANFENKAQEELSNVYLKFKDFLKNTWQDISEVIEANLNPQIEEEVLKKFGNQNPYIKESLVWDIDIMVEKISDILSEELTQQDIEFNEEDLEEQVADAIKPSVVNNIITKNEAIAEEAKKEIEKKQFEINELLSEQKIKEPLKVKISIDEDEEFIIFGVPDFKGQYGSDIEEIEISPETIEKRKQQQKAKYEKIVNALETISSILGEIKLISKKMMEYEANKKNTTIEEIEKEVIEAINIKPIEELKPVEKIYYNDTLLNKEIKKLEENFIGENDQSVKLGADKEADLVIDIAQRIYNKEIRNKLYDYLNNKNYLSNEEKKYIKYSDLLYTENDLLERIETLNKHYNKYGRLRFYDELEDGNNDYENYDIIVDYFKDKILLKFMQYPIQKELKAAEKENDAEKVLILDYYNDYYENKLNIYENYFKQDPEKFKEIEKLYNDIQPILENKFLKEEVEPGLIKYINFLLSNNVAIKNSIKELGNIIEGLTQTQLQKAIQNLTEEDRNKLIVQATHSLNVLLDAVKEYAPEVMESFDKLVKAQNIETQVKNYQISPEALQAIESKINGILGNSGLTQKVAKDKLIEITKGKILQEIENKVDKIVSTLENSFVTQPSAISLPALDFVEKGSHPVYKAPASPIKDAVYDLFEIDQLLRILYPIFKNMGLELSSYDITDPRQYRAHATEIIIPNSSFREKGHKFVNRYKDYIIPKFEELKNLIKNLPNFPDWLAKSTTEPNLEKAVQIAKENKISDPYIDEFMKKYKSYQNDMSLIRQRIEELYKIHASFVVAENEDEDDNMWGSVLGAVLGAVAAFATPWGAGILTPSILAGTATGTVTSVGLGALGGATLGGTLQGVLGAKEYSNSAQVQSDINELDNLMKDYYQKANEAQTNIRQKIIDLGTKKE